MKASALVVLLVLNTGLKAMILEDTAENVSFPMFNPNTAFAPSFPSSCSGFIDCTEFVGKVIIGIVQSIVWITLLIVEIIDYLIDLMVLLITVSFAPLEGTHWFVNLVLTAIPAAILAFLIFSMVRKGDTDA